jgi:hypothetical protein
MFLYTTLPSKLNPSLWMWNIHFKIIKAMTMDCHVLLLLFLKNKIK